MRKLVIVLHLVITSLAYGQISVSDVKYCGPGQFTVSNTDVGCVDYEWYGFGATLLGTGCDFTSPLIALDQDFYVQNPNSTSQKTIGYDFLNSGTLTGAADGWTDNDKVGKYTTTFNIKRDITLDSITFRYTALSWTPTGDIMKVSIIKKDGTVLKTIIPTLVFDGNRHLLKVGFALDLVPGEYKLLFEDAGSTSFVAEDKVWVHTGGADYSSGGFLDGNDIRITGNGLGNDSYGGAYSWEITAMESKSFVAFDTCSAAACSDVGAPLFVETFGSGGQNPGSALPSGVTTYTFRNLSGGVGATDGEYTIVNNPAAGMGTTISGWHPGKDHTPLDQDGYMLLVNADLAAGEFYRGEVNDLCDNTVYIFSAWLANLMIPNTCAQWNESQIKPDVTFRIEDGQGNVLMNEITGTIPEFNTMNWLKYEFKFFLPPNIHDVKLVLLNNGNGGCGNDIVLDDISFSPCVPALFVQAIDDMPACRNTDFRLKGLTQDKFSTADLQWQISYDKGGLWEDIPGGKDSLITTKLIQDSLTYRLLAIIGSGANAACPIISNQISIPTKICPVVEYQGFSPTDVDGKNDFWIIDNIDLFSNNEVQIFNRWGSLVWEEKGYDNNEVVWDGKSNVGTFKGKDLPKGAYFYIIRVLDEDTVLQGYVIIN